MSGTPPFSQSPHSSVSANSGHGLHTPYPTRTLAIIKPHAMKHRLEIEQRIIEAGFEIVKERQLEFHSEDESLEMLFGQEAYSMTGDPVWIYVLERKRAVEVWNTLMGNPDSSIAREQSPRSLRALYGGALVSSNGFFGSPDNLTAERQIATLFASSPLFPPVHLADPEEVLSPLSENGGQYRSHSGSVRSRDSSVQRTSLDDYSNKKVLFRARPVPSTNAVPESQPRMTKAAALRAGLAVPTTSKKPKQADPQTIARTFENVPGHKRAEVIAVASTAPPVVAPRQTRASLLREAKPAPTGGRHRPNAPRQSSSTSLGDQTFANTPGHKRAIVVPVASIAPPVVAPRPTKASALRAGEPVVAAKKPRPSSAVINPGTFEGVPGHKRSETVEVASVRPPSTAPRLNKAAELRAQGPSAPPSSFNFRGNSVPGRPSSQSGFRPPSRSNSAPRSATSDTEEPVYVRSPSATPADIPPRTNRSAMLRAKMGTPTAKKSTF